MDVPTNVMRTTRCHSHRYEKTAEENEFLAQLIADHGDTWLGMEAIYGGDEFYWESETPYRKE